MIFFRGERLGILERGEILQKFFIGEFQKFFRGDSPPLSTQLTHSS